MLRLSIRTLSVVMLAGLLTACGGGGSANGCVTTADSGHQVFWDVQAALKARLAVFLPGTGALPSDYPGYLRHGASRGYHVIGLSYPNPESVRVICNRVAGDATCAGNVREEMLTARNVSDLVATVTADAIEQRLLDLLKFLRRHRPDQPWSQYLTSSETVDWSKVSVSGHSQGAGHAGYIGKTRRVSYVRSTGRCHDHRRAVFGQPAPDHWPGLHSGRLGQHRSRAT